MKLAHKLILAWSLAWLPLSGVLATSMSLCVPSGVATQQAHAVDDHALVPTMDAEHCKKERQNNGSSGAPSCDSCDLCTIAHAMVSPTRLSKQAEILPEAVAILGTTTFASFYPEQLQRPPLSAPV